MQQVSVMYREFTTDQDIEPLCGWGGSNNEQTCKSVDFSQTIVNKVQRAGAHKGGVRGGGGELVENQEKERGCVCER